MIDDLVEALRGEFTDIVFTPNIPNTFTAPSVVVAPADPFLSNGTFGLITESWDVLCVASMKDKGSGLAQLRKMSLRVREAAANVGALWNQASGPRIPQSEEARTLVISANNITFKYDPTTMTEEA